MKKIMTAEEYFRENVDGNSFDPIGLMESYFQYKAKAVIESLIKYSSRPRRMRRW